MLDMSSPKLDKAVTLKETNQNYMPQALAIDKEEVRATYIATGSLTETARLHDLKEATVRQWAKRYNWETATNVLKLKKKADSIVELKREMGHKDTPAVSRSSDALALHLENSATSFRTNMAGALAKSSGVLSDMDGYEVLENSRRLVDLATAASKVFPMESNEARIQVNILGMSADALSLAKPIDC
jgi:uncharacterized protein YjcR